MIRGVMGSKGELLDLPRPPPPLKKKYYAKKDVKLGGNFRGYTDLRYRGYGE